MSFKNFNRLAIAILLCTVSTTRAFGFSPVQQPPASSAVPGNVVLALSVEHPTGLQASYTSPNYAVATRYDGYFDNRKCYLYSALEEVFKPISVQNIDGSCINSSQWSGNLLNWLTMTNIDQFRSVMSGGTRDTFSTMGAVFPGDTSTRTILIRSLSDRNEYNPIKNLTAGTQGMPLTGITRVRQGGYGSKFIVSTANNFSDMNAIQQRATCAQTPLPGLPGTSQCFNIRVEVCIPIGSAGLESNCKNTYTGVAKPEGLIQDYANSLRYSAFGYLKQDGNDRSGGVLRSAMKSVGPNAATASGVVANVAKEWSEVTGIQSINPDPSDAALSSVINSGLINYLNKFGYSSGYKSNDPVSELYYAAQLYLRGEAPPPNYSNDLNAALRDGFPVITGNSLLKGSSRDPIINSCQKNFILGIGDIYTHCDGNLPGSNKAGCIGGIPADPANLSAQALWDTTRALEGLADNGWVGGASNGTPYMAGLAHWANTTDIRADITGKQTISTYWVDVLENNNGINPSTNITGASQVKSQFWLAAKYGGFDTSAVLGSDPNTNRASWDINNRNIPDTWFAGSTPQLLKSGLSGAFANIAARSSANSASSAATTSNRQTSDSQVLYAGYNPKGWTGSLRACSPTQTADQCNNSPTWEASRWFKTTPPTLVPTPLTPATRKIFTSSQTTSFARMPFKWASLDVAQQASLNSDGLGSDRVEFLRGDRTRENGIFRKREDSLLGDIVNSGVTYLSGALPAYSGPNFLNHSAYRASVSARPAVAYVGANDGMLHAFSGENGKELFGYIPGAVFENLPALSTTNFVHRFFVDSTPMIGDIQKNATTWGTVLVGGLGAGGKGYYALDITSQSNFATATEATLSNLPIWEFTSSQDSDLGFTFNEPSLNPLTGAYKQIAKVADTNTASGNWRVIVGNGYGSASGKSALFMLDANSGSVATKLTAEIGPNNGLSTPTPIDTDNDGLVDTVYAGDLLGNLHKFQFSKSAGADLVLAESGEAGGAWRYIGKVFASGEPITTAPSVGPAADGNGWMVSFGTGKLNEANDDADTSPRGFYNVIDRGASSNLTVSSSDLVNIPYVTTVSGGVTTRNWTTPNLTGKLGWKMVFTGGERVLSNSTLPPDTGNVLFGTTKPSGDSCTPGNTGFVMAVNLASGKVGNLVVAGIFVGGVGVNSTGVVKVSNTYTNSTNKQAVVCNQDGCKGPQSPVLLPAITPKGRYSWREILSK